ncbi:MAG: hypothetical protein MI723_14765 [Caulobacterales bacterium]|nr:hypothetical protein [Caulobacterales bacterium]
MPSAWTAEFEFRRDHLRVRKTGAVVPYTTSIAKEALDWLRLFAVLKARRAGAALLGRGGPTIAFVPQRARPWYLVWAAASAAGARVVADPGQADIVMYFDDVTESRPPSPMVRADARLINFTCADTSKSHVAAVFEQVFERPLAVDPRNWTGPAVEKSERNGAHDGRIVDCPCAPQPGHAYQRVIEATDGDGYVEDLRCPTVDGNIPVVFIKRRPIGRRFANANAQSRLVAPSSVLSAEERDQLRRFTRAMGLDWGGLDVLRDRRDGAIYVVDVNKTDMGPPTVMPLSDQIIAVTRLAEAFRAAFFPADAPS